VLDKAVRSTYVLLKCRIQSELKMTEGSRRSGGGRGIPASSERLDMNDPEQPTGKPLASSEIIGCHG